MTKKKTLLVALIVLVLIVCTSSQFGGGGRIRIGRSRGSRGSKPLTQAQRRAKLKEQEIKIIKKGVRLVYQFFNGKQKNKIWNEHYYQHQGFYQLPSFFIVAGFTLFLIILFDKYREYLVIRQYEHKMCITPCTMTDQQCQDIINRFIETARIMTIKFTDEEMAPLRCELSQIKIIKKDKQAYRYDIFMRANDIVGASQFEGRMFFWGNGFGFKAFKDYDDRRKAKQKGSFNWLLYEGFSSDNRVWNGNWAFKGHQTEKPYSGTWEMKLQGH